MLTDVSISFGAVRWKHYKSSNKKTPRREFLHLVARGGLEPSTRGL